MISRRAFIGFCGLSFALVPVLGCIDELNDTDISWFLSEQEMLRIGESYSSNSFTAVDTEIVLVNGWVLTLAEAEVCKKKFLKRA